MKSLIYSFLIVVFCSIPGKMISQGVVKDLDQVYGLDQTLCNGKKYVYTPPPGTTRNQYLVSPFYTPGSVKLKGKVFRNILLNYDIFNQQLLLQYANDDGPLNIIEISKAWLNGFSLGNRNFELLKPDQEQRFYQVLGEGPVRILYFWRKTLNLNNAIGTYNFVFSNAIRDSYVLLDGQLKPFNSNRSLVKLFEQGKRPEIKSYLHKNRVKVKKASDQEMTEMVNFIGKLR